MNKANGFEGKKKGRLGYKFHQRSNEPKKNTVKFIIEDRDDVSEISEQKVKFGTKKSKRGGDSIVNSRRSKFTRKQTKFSQKSGKSN